MALMEIYLLKGCPTKMSGVKKSSTWNLFERQVSLRLSLFLGQREMWTLFREQIITHLNKINFLFCEIMIT